MPPPIRAALHALARAAQPVERRRRLFALAGGVRELLLDAVALAQQRLELRVEVAPRERRDLLALVAVRAALVDRGEVELRDARAQARELAGQLLRALGGGRLQRERPQPLAHLLFDIARALDLRRDARELQLRAVPARLELAEPRGLLQQRAALRRLGAEDLFDLPWPMIECMPPPRPTSASSSTRSSRRTGVLLTRYWPSPPRCSRRAIETSDHSNGPSPAPLSKSSSTSQ